jgi:hypothetical protein
VRLHPLTNGERTTAKGIFRKRDHK